MLLRQFILKPLSLPLSMMIKTAGFNSFILIATSKAALSHYFKFLTNQQGFMFNSECICPDHLNGNTKFLASIKVVHFVRLVCSQARQIKPRAF